MNPTALKDVLQRAETLPPEGQEELLRAALYIEQRHSGDFALTGEDRKIIDARLVAARLGAIASDEEVAAETLGGLKNARKENTLDGISRQELRDAGRK